MTAWKMGRPGERYSYHACRLMFMTMVLTATTEGCNGDNSDYLR